MRCLRDDRAIGRRAVGWALAVCVALALPARGQESPERRRARAWAAAALLGSAEAKRPPRAGVKLVRQDHGAFLPRRSTLNTPLRVGAKRYARGLGTHAVSEIAVRLPRPGRRFQADVGIDNNHDTGGKRGSVIFVVEVAGREAYRSRVCRGGEAPRAVRVDLKGARQFVLRVLDAGDGPGWDQADWAAASVIFQDGKTMFLDEMVKVSAGTELSGEVPFSFTYGGKASAGLLGSWKRTRRKRPAADGLERHDVRYVDPATGLEIVCEVTLFAGYPAAEWVLRIRNTGTGDTPILENILPLDLRSRDAVPGDVVLHHAHGSTCTPTDFLPIDQPVAPKSELKVAPSGGRSSNGRLPFFNLAWQGGGVVGAIGWSGQWELNLTRGEGGDLRLRVGQQGTHLKLHPGESIRTPRILLVMWQGEDRIRGHNLLRRVLLDHYVPRRDGQVVVPPITQNTWFVYNTGNDVTEKNQKEIIDAMAPLGVEAYWLDAGWFEGGWPAGAGSWVPKSKAFPNGLKPVGDAAHQRGMKFVLWFEPERVNPASRIAKEHAEWVLRTGPGDGLFNLGDPAARKWLTDMLSKCIEDWGIDVYRNDFNIDPLGFWQAADKPDRKGIAEIRYVEGLYAMWDELRKRHPHLVIDNCASGGRRIDLETTRRSLPLWRSDTQCFNKALPIQDQAQTAGLSLYVPLHAGGCWGFEPYVFRSIATTGTNLCQDTRAKDFPVALAKAAIAEAKALRPLVLGDYYPLLPINVDEHHWCGWQLDRPDLGKGLAVLFRRSKSPYAAVDVALKGIDAGAAYDVTFSETYEVKQSKRMSGADLARLRVAVDSVPGSVLILYRRADAKATTRPAK